jgi:hypothetical protein
LGWASGLSSDLAATTCFCKDSLFIDSERGIT